MDTTHAHRPVSGRGLFLLRQQHDALQWLCSIWNAPWLHAALLSIATVACGDAAAPSPVVVIDSAGVRVTTSTASTRIYAVVDSQPAVQLGGPNADGSEQFFNIHGVYLDPSNNIWVANRGSNEVRVFRPDGSHWKTFGRAGSGPGEFRGVRLLGSFRPDRIAVWDDGNPRLTLLTAQGELADVITIELEGSVPQAFGVFPVGSLLIRKSRVIAASAISPGTVFRDTVALLEYDHVRNQVTELGNAIGTLWLWTGRSQVPIPFTTAPSYAVDPVGALHVADGPEFRIRVLKNGSVTESYGVDRSARDVTDADITRYREFYTANMGDDEALRAYLSALDHPSTPKKMPAYSQLLISSVGNVWARIYSPDLLAAADWDVFAPDRHLLGTVRTPSGLIVDAIGVDRLVGVLRDELGVESVRVYQPRARTRITCTDGDQGRGEIARARQGPREIHDNGLGRSDLAHGSRSQIQCSAKGL